MIPPHPTPRNFLAKSRYKGGSGQVETANQWGTHLSTRVNCNSIGRPCMT